MHIINLLSVVYPIRKLSDAIYDSFISFPIIYLLIFRVILKERVKMQDLYDSGLNHW